MKSSILKMWLFIFMLTSLSINSNNIKPQWALDISEEHIIYTIGELIYEFEKDSQPDSLWFDAKKGLLGAGVLKIAQKIDDSWVDIWENNIAREYQQYGGIKLDENTSAIKFYTEFGSIFNKNIKNVKVNNRWHQTITWEQELHNIIIGEKIILTAAIEINDGISNWNTPIIYSSSDPNICEIKKDTLITLQKGKASITASHNGDLFLYPAESIVRYANINLTSNINNVYIDKETIIIYPNPCSTGKINIKGQAITEIEIMSISGHKLYSSYYQNAQTIEIDVSNFPIGFYLIRIIDSKVAQNLNLIIN